MPRYDLLVIGTGSAATAAAHTVRSAGWNVVIVDCRPPGGTCALRGCDPKKVLVGVASVADGVRRYQGSGVSGNVEIDWPELLAFKRSFTDPVPESRERAFAESGIEFRQGTAKFIGPTMLDVQGEQLEARHILIATGAEPMILGIDGEEHLIDSTRFLSMPELPRRVVIVGGGYIAAEFSGIAAAAGADVTILQRGDRLLKNFDTDLVAWLVEAFESRGIVVRTQTTAEGVEKTPAGFTVHVSTNGKADTIAADLVVHAAGRTPALAELDLDAAGVATDKGRLCLNEYLQSTSNSAVYAAGDAAQAGPPLTPVSGHDASIVAANLLQGNHAKPDYRGIPSVAFSIPPIATVGLGEREARERGHKFRMSCDKASAWYTARQQHQPAYGFKVLAEEDTGRILGAHLLGPHVDETINLFALAIRHGLTSPDLKSSIYSYPSGASDIPHMLRDF